MKHIHNHRELALAYHRRLPERIRTYLLSIGISNSIICRYRIGWDGSRITIPISDRERRVTYFRLLRDPEADASSPELISWPEIETQLYGWERIVSRREGVVICCGEINRLILESHGIGGVGVLGDLSTLNFEWARLLCQIPTVYVCLSPGEATRTAREFLTKTLPGARLIPPDALGVGGIVDFFVTQCKTLEDFDALCSQAAPLVWKSIATDNNG